ncbi:MAG: DNA polymerase III subunit epsilon [Legionellales bacterium]|nr:DNA polymerase III subunit epsilon [Legionellales bacterium]
MKRQIVLDTETTGLDPKLGHRIIEIGCIEIVDRRITRKSFHHYINPERDIDAGALNVHGLSRQFLADKPRFNQIVQDFIHFIEGAELVIHNAAFDVGFIDHELQLLNQGYGSITSLCPVIDTLVLARKLHPGQKNSLDALCKRYDIDNSSRDWHGALLDARLLAGVYLAMTGGQSQLFAELNSERSHDSHQQIISNADSPRENRLVIPASREEVSAHQQFLTFLQQHSESEIIWKN